MISIERCSVKNSVFKIKHLFTRFVEDSTLQKWPINVKNDNIYNFVVVINQTKTLK